jgi:hypothetical protein
MSMNSGCSRKAAAAVAEAAVGLASWPSGRAQKSEAPGRVRVRTTTIARQESA